MSLPDKHRTARYESLQGGLKAKAEAIIKKKFGLDLKEKMDADGWDKEAIEAVAFKPRKTIVLNTDDYYTRYMPSEQRYRADAECPDCYEEHVEYYTVREVVEYNAIGRVWICEDCKAELSLTIRTETFPKKTEPKEDTRSRFNIGDRVIVKNKEVLNYHISIGDSAEYLGQGRYRMINGACAGMVQLDSNEKCFEKFEASVW